MHTIQKGNMVSNALDLLKKFYALQEERVQTYQLFDEGFQAYLAGAPEYNFPMYRQLVHEITETFKNISEEIIGIEKKLRQDHGLPAVGNYIVKIQDDEKLKLELTAKLQIDTQNVVDFPEDDSYKEGMQSTKQSLRQVIDRINDHLEELKYETEDLYT
ncbi:required for excision 1-B domain-containing protein [Lingula anatina]|uniref:Required for excision 1-B domain-containing protein n=1 Tax=Lingula anatina TaxID=7574 RepID=A0A1S3JA43_LINAN|nr:required for excision 1-B domain-containing protein [Lingula anatina]|eukprot:XP_013407275.1 required for excision 1-B domain-containing protein [Lingula anatina]